MPKTFPKGMHEGTFEERQAKRLKWDRKVLRDFDPEQPDKWPGFPGGFWILKPEVDSSSATRARPLYPELCYSGIGRHWLTGEWMVRMQIPDPSWENGNHLIYPLSHVLHNYGPKNCEPGVQGIDPDWKF